MSLLWVVGEVAQGERRLNGDPLVEEIDFGRLVVAPLQRFAAFQKNSS
jgi:hypothetical protein